MNVVRVGNPITIFSYEQSSSQNITVPSGASYVVISTAGFGSSLNFMSSGTLTLSGQALTALRTDGTNNFYNTTIWGKVDPATGSLAWSWTEFPEEGVVFFVTFYTDVDPGSPIRHTGGQYATTGESISTGELTAQNGDRILAVGASPTATGNITWTGATQSAGGIFNFTQYAIAEVDPSTNTAISFTSFSDTRTISAIVLAYDPRSKISNPSLIINPVILTGVLTKDPGEIYNPELILQPNIGVGDIQAAGVGLLHSPQLIIQPIVNTGDFFNLDWSHWSDVFNFYTPGISPKLIIDFSISTGQLIGDLSSPKLYIQPSISTGQLIGGLSSPKLYIQPYIRIEWEYFGSLDSPTVYTAFSIATGQLVGDLSSPKITIKPNVVSGVLAGDLNSPKVIIKSFISTGQLVGDLSSPKITIKPILCTGSILGDLHSPSLLVYTSVSVGQLIGDLSSPRLYVPFNVYTGSLITYKLTGTIKVYLDHYKTRQALPFEKFVAGQRVYYLTKFLSKDLFKVVTFTTQWEELSFTKYGNNGFYLNSGPATNAVIAVPFHSVDLYRSQPNASSVAELILEDKQGYVNTKVTVMAKTLLHGPDSLLFSKSLVGPFYSSVEFDSLPAKVFVKDELFLNLNFNQSILLSANTSKDVL